MSHYQIIFICSIRFAILSVQNTILHPTMSIYRIDHGFEINIRGLAEDIYREIHGLSYLDNTTLT